MPKQAWLNRFLGKPRPGKRRAAAVIAVELDAVDRLAGGIERFSHLCPSAHWNERWVQGSA